MDNSIDFYSKLKEEDLLLKKIFGDNNDKYLNIFLLINRIINNLKEDTIIVAPNKKELAYISSIYSSLSFFYKNYQAQHKNFEKWLKPGQNVRLVASGIHTGTVFKYQGKEGDKIIIETIPKKITKTSPTKITTRFETILQFAPTNAIRNMNNRKDIGIIPKPLIPTIDKLLNIKSFKNPILYENKVLLLNNSVEKFEDFFDKETLTKNDKEYKINELITFGKINVDGCVDGAEAIDEEKKLEKNIIATSNIDRIYEYLSKNMHQKIIIGSEIKRISSESNFIQYKQIKNLKNKSNFIIFADDNDFEDIKEFKRKTHVNVFKLFDEHLKDFFTKEDNKKNIFQVDTKIYKDIETKISKKIISINVGNETFEEIDQCFENINSSLFQLDEITFEDAKELLNSINNLRFKLRDHIFGFTEELSIFLKESLKVFWVELKSRQSQFNEKIYNNFSSILQLLDSLPKDGLNIFDVRLKEFHEILKINDPINTIIYSYNLERKKYYEENINKKFNLKFKAIESKKGNRKYENIIIPSEIVGRDIIKLINNSNYKNLFFLGSKNLMKKINTIKTDQINQWEKLIIEQSKKIEILKVDSSFRNFLPNPNFIKKITTKETQNDSLDDKNILTTPVKLYGDRGVYFSENFNTEILNPILDPSSFSSNKINKNVEDIIEGDILLLRDSSDKDILNKEALNIYKTKKLNINYDDFKNIALGLQGEIRKSFGVSNYHNDYVSIDLINLRKCLKIAGYTSSNQTIRLIANGITGCPNDINDLNKFIKACEINNSNYKYNEDLVNKIFRFNREYKNILIEAGRSIRPKILNALRSNPEISFDGEPLRVDYNTDGSISLGEDKSDKPEGWIVQVQKVYKSKKVSKNYNSVNTLI